MQAIEFLAAPFALAILLVGIHAYLGLHVLKRDVIFVDISLSQVAALGSAVSLFFVHEGDGAALALTLSLTFCLATSFALALLRHHEKSVSQEALIGMTYALASGALILVADKLPHGSEHLKEALIGNILFVTWPQVLQTFSIYSVIGVIHWIFRKQFWQATYGKEGMFWWDFLFYFLFGIVITFSTRHAGVLVVFSILVAPASLAMRFFPGNNGKLASRLSLSWIFGTIGLGLAFLLSYNLDLPSGASIVCTLTSLFFLALLIRRKRFDGDS
ncbi:MAG: metal ABC transporter permease [Deltaproteobacteria bacterium]|jgi:zinc/manganese transport system permease protein|nr:metal ABC transporter permease [Deltaproteobacteria bacterium]